jgi:hypothetical protein
MTNDIGWVSRLLPWINDFTTRRTPSLVLTTLLAITPLATLLAMTPHAYSGQTSAAVPSTATAPSVAKGVHVSVDPRSFGVVIDRNAIAKLDKGQLVSVAIAGIGRFEYVLDTVNKDADILKLGGHVVGDVNQKIALGIGAEGVTGLIDTPTQTYALGYTGSNGARIELSTS